MTWAPPKNEAQWQELLSALLDEELEPAEAQAVAQHLKSDPTHAAQLHNLAARSRQLRAWPRENLAPPAALINAARGADDAVVGAQLEARQRRRGVWMSRVALLSAGLIVGAGGGAIFYFSHPQTKIVNVPGPERIKYIASAAAATPTPVKKTPTPALPAVSPAATTSVASVSAASGASAVATPLQIEGTQGLSLRQVDRLIRESEAEALSARLHALLAEGKLDEARATADRIREHYADTQVYRQLQRQVEEQSKSNHLMMAERF